MNTQALLQVRVVEGRHLFKALPDGDDVSSDVFSRKKGGSSSNSQGRNISPLLNAAMCVSISYGGQHQLTENSHDLARPVWDKAVTFKVGKGQEDRGVLVNGADSSIIAGDVEAGLAVEMTDMASSKSVPSSSTSPQLGSRSPRLASGRNNNTLPPPLYGNGASSASSLPTPPLLRMSSSTLPPAVPSISHSALHFRVFCESLVSKELLGEVVLDLGSLIASGGEVLTPDCVVHSRWEKEIDATPSDVPWASRVPPPGIAVDTWIALRDGAGELHVQLVIRSDLTSQQPLVESASPIFTSISPEGVNDEGEAVEVESEAEDDGAAEDAGWASDNLPVVTEPPPVPLSLSQHSEPPPSTLPVKPAKQRWGSSGGSGNLTPSKPRGSRRRPRPWETLERFTTELGQPAKISTPPAQPSLASRLSAMEEQYCYSYTLAYSQTTGTGIVALPDPDGRESVTVEGYSPTLLRNTQYTFWREQRQQESWARQLVASPELREAIVDPPSFRALLGAHRGAGGKAGVRVHGRSVNIAPAEYSLIDLVTNGIAPSLSTLKHGGGIGENLYSDVAAVGKRSAGAGAVAASVNEHEINAFAFAGEEVVRDMLLDVKAAIPRVEVIRVSGHMCCAEYSIEVTVTPPPIVGTPGSNTNSPTSEPVAPASWIVLRRYSDFRSLYAALPSTLIAVIAPLPPKSWRSLSHLTMTPEFLEDRRAALEAVLRRLLRQVASGMGGGGVREALRSFLGLSRSDASLGTGLLPELLPSLELSLEEPLPANGRRDRSKGSLGSPGRVLHVAEDLRLVMWLVLSGGAKRAREAARAGISYASLSAAAMAEDEGMQNGNRSVRSDDSHLTSRQHFDAIDVDVNRTYVRSDAEREAVRRVLRSFALGKPEVGYCQSMNFVALFLLRTAHGYEDVAFWLLTALATDVVPRYWEGVTCMVRLQGDLAVLRNLAGVRMPALLSHLDAIGLPLELLACDWVLSLFCRVLPPLTVLRVWDWLLLEGADALLFVAMAILRFAEDEMLQVQGTCANADKLLAMAAAIHDADELIENAVAERDSVFAASNGGATNLAELRMEQERSAAKIAAAQLVSETITSQRQQQAAGAQNTE